MLDGGSALRLTAQMLGALTAAHAAAVIHRDIKPGNILAGSHEEWKLGDFGIAKAVELPTGDQTVTGLLLGTPAYLAPERFFGDEATVRSDLYSLAVVIYEALAGRRPFVGNTPQQWASAKLAGQTTPLGGLRPDVDPALTAAVDRCLRPDPDQRFETAAEMVDAVFNPPARHRATPVGASPRPDPTAVLSHPAVPGRSRIPMWLRPAGAGRGGWVRHLGAAVAAAAVLALVVIVLMSTAGTSGGSAPQPSPTTTVAGPQGSGALPPGLDQALRHLQSEVGR
ncbi:MAG: serine/threonine protein kinase [Acidobacteriota bacterium]|nr:serine/threonine protein kinase [Acidobacteriota bacterium]